MEESRVIIIDWVDNVVKMNGGLNNGDQIWWLEVGHGNLGGEDCVWRFRG